ncbi:MAG: hypothetical protein HND47_05705 [Chloroflexi bacterium]|nr:hypothetical protein [Chloroflexota bacterium]
MPRQGAFHRQWGDAFDLAEDQPQPKQDQTDGQDVHAPSEQLREDENETANDRRAVGGDQPQEKDDADERQDDADHVQFTFGGEVIPPRGFARRRRVMYLTLWRGFSTRSLPLFMREGFACGFCTFFRGGRGLEEGHYDLRLVGGN